MTLPFPDIDPVAVQIGPVLIRWYALAYLAGILTGWWWALRNIGVYADKHWNGRPNKDEIDTLISYVILGIVLGGRLGYVLFYNPAHYLHNLGDIPKIWHGGMSFHGGVIGVMTAFGLFCIRHKLPYLRVGDIVAYSVPFGLFFGRIANFINGELYGRVTDVPWAVLFPQGGYLPRHPSQLYEAVLEGPVLFAALFAIARTRLFTHASGFLGFSFICGYALIRFALEFVREPDAQLGYLGGFITMGQLLSLVMLLAGIAGMLSVWRRYKHQNGT